MDTAEPQPIPAMRIVAFLQNQWLNNAEQHERVLTHYKATDIEHYWKLRRRMIPFALFRGCLTGRRIKAAFGESLCDEIVWEEASPKIASKSSGAFPADVGHMQSVIVRETPDVVLCFGLIAQSGFRQLLNRPMMIPAPHPAARHAAVKRELQNASATLRKLLPCPTS
jgi:hypothetical protein